MPADAVRWDKDPKGWVMEFGIQDAVKFRKTLQSGPNGQKYKFISLEDVKAMIKETHHWLIMVALPQKLAELEANG